MISKIQAIHYRCFNQLAVSLQPYNVLAGANGSGKSTLLDIPLVLGDMLSQGSVPAFLEPSKSTGSTRAGSLQELIHCQLGDYFGFALEAPLPQNVVTTLVGLSSPGVQTDRKRWPQFLRYEVRFQIFNGFDLSISDEFLYLLSEASKTDNWVFGARPRSWRAVITREQGSPVEIGVEAGREKKIQLRLEPSQLALANLPLDASVHPASVWFVEMLKDGMMHYEPDLAKLRTASRPGQPRTLRPDAQNLPWLVLNLKQERPRRFDAWVEHVQTALPNVTSIDASIREDDHYAYLRIGYQGGYTVTSSGLSSGTLRILALTIAPYLSNPPRVLTLEEPEDGIHPRAIETVLQSLSSLYESQVWLSTHSPFVLAHTPLKAIIVMRRNSEGAVDATLGDKHPRLRDWSGEIDIGSLFAAGVLE